ncbi:MAG: hypothetical protein A2V64_06980 [Bacteroidetes bacterium RBG_13_43_22]|nr:MAG: hypothetical protein A2V64_06980 [Bacteroidetes bacterium RBG_13_43_22]
MILLLRIVLISLIIYLLVRSFARFFQGEDERSEVRDDKKPSEIKKVSRDTGEYVDYEEVDKE